MVHAVYNTAEIMQYVTHKLYIVPKKYLSRTENPFPIRFRYSIGAIAQWALCQCSIKEIIPSVHWKLIIFGTYDNFHRYRTLQLTFYENNVLCE